jgi:hypothetical protein
MANPAIPRDQVHTFAEACSDEAEAFNPTATRLVKDQRRLSRFFEQNMDAMDPMAAQVALYMLSVSLRVFEQVGGRMKKVNGADLAAAGARVNAQLEAIFPADAGFGERAKAADRAQPHLLDEILWALYERDGEDKKDAEVDLEPEQSAMVYLLLWTAVEALDANWGAPAGYQAA